MSAPALSDRVRPSADVVVQEIAGEAVLLDLATESYFGLDPVGLVVWRALAAGGSLADARSAVLGAFAVEPDVAERDLLAFVATLRDAGLVTVDVGRDGP
jgi:hypothetical protein